MMPVVSQIVSDNAAFGAIAPEWNALVERSGPDALFCRHEVLTLNLRRHQALRPGAMPHLVLLRRNGQLVGGFPLLLRRDRLGTGVVEWLGSGTPLYAVPPGDLPPAELAAVVRAELRRVPFLRKFKVDFVPADSVFASALRDLGAEEVTLAPRLMRDLSLQGLAGTVSLRRTKKLRQYHKRFAALGDLSIQTVTDPADLADLAAWIMAIKRDWVMQRHGADTWATDPATGLYFRDLSERLAIGGRAWGTALRLDGKRVCANLLFQQGDRVFWSKTAHLAEHAALSPGWVALEHSLNTAIDRGAAKMDMMMGSSYLKETLATERGPISNFRLGLNPLAGLWPWRGRMARS